MPALSNILTNLSPKQLRGNPEVEIKDLSIDSRKVSAGTAFIAVRGSVSDGHQYIAKAVELGAVAIICEQLPSEMIEGITYVQVTNSSYAAGLAASNFYGQPSKKMKVVGVTGTNGKTTVATLLYKTFRELGHICGLISTVQNHINDEVISATHTTPDAISVQSLLSKMAEAGCTHVFMEVSSHDHMGPACFRHVTEERLHAYCVWGRMGGRYNLVVDSILNR